MSLTRAVVISLNAGLVLLGACGSDAADKTAGPGMTYKLLLQRLYHNTVPTVLPAALARELAQPAPPLLLDVRRPIEFRISHLSGARFVNADSIATAHFPDLPRSQPLVVYCSVGVRSERLGERLHALGFEHVRNLYGGLFEWVNEGYPVYDSNGLTSNVHPYSAMWSPWLKRGNKVYE